MWQNRIKHSIRIAITRFEWEKEKEGLEEEGGKNRGRAFIPSGYTTFQQTCYHTYGIESLKVNKVGDNISYLNSQEISNFRENLPTMEVLG